jgi:hypothetical protein
MHEQYKNELAFAYEHDNHDANYMKIASTNLHDVKRLIVFSYFMPYLPNVLRITSVFNDVKSIKGVCVRTLDDI